MATATSSLLSLFLFFLFQWFAGASSITVPLNSAVHDAVSTARASASSSSNNPPQLPYVQFPYSRLARLASASLGRANRIKHNPSGSVSPHASISPIYPQSYGGYSISLQFGTPPQSMPLIVDTGSDLVWFPCTHNYICQNCNSSSSSSNSVLSLSAATTTSSSSSTSTYGNNNFIPKLSSTSRILSCSSPKCGWIHRNPDPSSRCTECSSPPIPNLSTSKSKSKRNNNNNCTQICPPYIVLYGSGSTGGLALTETLTLSTGERVPDLLVGCSLFSSHLPSGIAGLGRGPTSLPAQLRLTRFSFCLPSHAHRNHPGFLTLDPSPSTGRKTPGGVKYTPFQNNPKVPGKLKAPYSAYYYVRLRKITVGGARVGIPNQYLSADPVTGSGGTVVDSGSALTYMARGVFGPLARQFEKQLSYLSTDGYKRDRPIEKLTGLQPCFNVSDDNKLMRFPKVKLHFKGGEKVTLPIQNYMVVVELEGSTTAAAAACLAVVTDGVGWAGGVVGPAIVLGSFQMQGFYVEFDLDNDRFGLKRDPTCGW